MSWLRLVCLACLLSLVSACASFDRGNLSRLDPLKVEDNVRYFKFTAVSPVGYSHEQSSDDEELRKKWLEWHLANNDLSTSHYEIVSREVIVTGDALLGKSYRIFYIVKVARLN